MFLLAHAEYKKNDTTNTFASYEKKQQKIKQTTSAHFSAVFLFFFSSVYRNTILNNEIIQTKNNEVLVSIKLPRFIASIKIIILYHTKRKKMPIIFKKTLKQILYVFVQCFG